METDKAEKLLMRIGSAILSDPGMRNRDWDSLACVAFVDDSAVSVFGYIYIGSNTVPFAPEQDALYDLLPAFRDATASKDNRHWRACLIQIVQPDLDFEVTYEYDDPARWRATPDTIDDLPEQLRPSFAD